MDSRGPNGTPSTKKLTNMANKSRACCWRTSATAKLVETSPNRETSTCKRRGFCVRYLSVFLLLANCVMADTVFFRDGHTVNGSYVGGDARTIRVAVGDRVETIRVADVDRISFGEPERAYAPPVLRTPPEEPAYRPAPAEEPPPPRRDDFGDRAMIPSGAVLTI